MLKKIPDSFLLGIILGIASLSLFYAVLAYIRLSLAGYYGNPYLLQAPKVQLFSIFLNVLFFRFLLVSFEKEKFGKGVLFSTAILSFVYFFYYFRYHQSLIGQ